MMALSKFFYERQKINFLDVIVVIVLIVAAIVVGLYLYDFGLPPAEDAAILMRYSDNFANGDGIVWNVGEEPVDGATDFLFMALVAGLGVAGISASQAVFFVGYFAHIATVFLVYFAVRGLWQSNRAVSAAATLMVIVGPGLGYVAASFGTTMFAFFGALTWMFAVIYTKRTRHVYAALFAVSALITGLIRPEGVFLTSFMVVAILFYVGRQSWRAILWYVIIFATVGGGYFLWRWSYFGYPLPNPFYKKGGGSLYVYHLRESITTFAQWSFPFNLALLAGLRSRPAFKNTIFILIPTAGFIGIWILLSDEMNILGRFQYAALPIFAMSWPLLIDGLAKDWNLEEALAPNWKQGVLIGLMSLVAIGQAAYMTLPLKTSEQFLDGRYAIATMLNEYAGQDYTIATTEAGLLPYYSQWQAIDAWGLNDQWIAHNGGITEEYLDQYEPEIIMFHAFYSPLSLDKVPDYEREDLSGWGDMLSVLQSYAEDHDYVLAAVFGTSPYDTHYYYIKPDFADSDELVERIRATEYVWPQDGLTAINFVETS